MTLTLERHLDGRVVLRPLATFRTGDWYFRHVLLVHESSGRPVEMGAIRIKLRAFRPRIQEQILAKCIPLGRILREGRLAYKPRPKSFLSITPNVDMMGVFWMREPQTLYGRRTEIFQRGTKIADIVEVLPRVSQP